MGQIVLSCVKTILRKTYKKVNNEVMSEDLGPLQQQNLALHFWEIYILKLILDRFNTRSNLLCMNSSATGWRGPKAPDSQEPTHVPRRARWKGAEGPLPSSLHKTELQSSNMFIIQKQCIFLYDFNSSFDNQSLTSYFVTKMLLVLKLTRVKTVTGGKDRIDIKSWKASCENNLR